MTAKENTTPAIEWRVNHDPLLVAIGHTVEDLVSRYFGLEELHLITEDKTKRREIDRRTRVVHRQINSLIRTAGTLEATGLPAAVVQLRALADWGNEAMNCEGEITAEDRDIFFQLVNSITAAVERAAGVDRGFAAGDYFISSPPAIIDTKATKAADLPAAAVED